MAVKKAMVNWRRFLKIYLLKFCDIWQNFYFYRILNNDNFKMAVEQTNWMTTVQFIIDYLKSCLLQFRQISFKW